jgi:hypothetical protein
MGIKNFLEVAKKGKNWHIWRDYFRRADMEFLKEIFSRGFCALETVFSFKIRQ